MATLVLEDGTTFTGRLFGANVSVSGEVGKSFQVLAKLKLHCNTAASYVIQTCEVSKFRVVLFPLCISVVSVVRHNVPRW